MSGSTRSGQRTPEPIRPAIFLDRDGTINVPAPEHEYVRRAEDFRWLPDALEGMVTLARAGLPLIVVSNQRGVGKGLVTHATLKSIEDRIQGDLSLHGCKVTAFRYCTHDIDADCDCRKPRPGLLIAAASQLDVDLSRSWMIGDDQVDVAAGRAAGCRTIRVGGAVTDGKEPSAASLLEAARLVLENVSQEGATRSAREGSW